MTNILAAMLDDRNNKHLMTGPEGNSEFCFPRISMFPETKSRETLRFDYGLDYGSEFFS